MPFRQREHTNGQCECGPTRPLWSEKNPPRAHGMQVVQSWDWKNPSGHGPLQLELPAARIGTFAKLLAVAGHSSTVSVARLLDP